MPEVRVPRLLAMLILCICSACAIGPGIVPATRDYGTTIALVGATIYTAPDSDPIRDGVLVVSGTRILTVGTRGETRIPDGAAVLDVSGRTIVPGFWNSHVHLVDPEWEELAGERPERVSDRFREAFTRFGFVRVFDIASSPAATLPLRNRIHGGEVDGPDILTTLLPFVPPDGTPRYVAPLRLPELHSPAAAVDSVRHRLAEGADAIKLFLVPITNERPFPIMAPEIVRAVSDEAHRAGKPVFAHPTDLTGVLAAINGGVNILAHSAPSAGALPDPVIREMHRRGMAMIPTLTLWELDFGADTVGLGQFVRSAQGQVRAFAEHGGTILFGTDAGYTTRFDPTREYELMAGAGMDFRAILASLTTAPAERFGWSARTGRLRPGLDADIVVIDGDPALDIRALGQVRLTLKRGRVLYAAEPGGLP